MKHSMFMEEYGTFLFNAMQVVAILPRIHLQKKKKKKRRTCLYFFWLIFVLI